VCVWISRLIRHEIQSLTPRIINDQNNRNEECDYPKEETADEANVPSRVVAIDNDRSICRPPAAVIIRVQTRCVVILPFSCAALRLIDARASRLLLSQSPG